MCRHRIEMFAIPHKDRDVRVIYTILPQSNLGPLYCIPYVLEAPINTAIHSPDINCIVAKLSSDAINDLTLTHHCCTRLQSSGCPEVVNHLGSYTKTLGLCHINCTISCCNIHNPRVTGKDPGG